MKRLVIVAIALIGLAAKPGRGVDELPNMRECRQGKGPAECYVCCLEALRNFPELPPRLSTEKACGAFCKNLTPQPPSDSVPQ